MSARWPWSVIRELRVDNRGLRRALSACQKKQNRLHARVKVLDAACSKHHGQARHDQAYIDALEARLETVLIAAARDEARLALLRLSVRGANAPESEGA